MQGHRYIQGVSLVSMETFRAAVRPDYLETLLQSGAFDSVITRNVMPLYPRPILEDLLLNLTDFEINGFSLDVDPEAGTLACRTTSDRVAESVDFIKQYIEESKGRVSRKVRPFPINGSNSFGLNLLIGTAARPSELLTAQDSSRILVNDLSNNITSGGQLDNAIVSSFRALGVSDEYFPSDCRKLKSFGSGYAEFSRLEIAQKVLPLLHQAAASQGPLRGATFHMVALHSDDKSLNPFISRSKCGVKVMYEICEPGNMARVFFGSVRARNAARTAYETVRGIGRMYLDDISLDSREAPPDKPFLNVSLSRKRYSEMGIYGMLKSWGITGITNVEVYRRIQQDRNEARELNHVRHAVNELLGPVFIGQVSEQLNSHIIAVNRIIGTDFPQLDSVSTVMEEYRAKLLSELHKAVENKCTVKQMHPDPVDFYAHGQASCVIEMETPEQALRVAKLLHNTKQSFHHSVNLNIIARLDHSAVIVLRKRTLWFSMVHAFKKHWSTVTAHFANAGHLVWMRARNVEDNDKDIAVYIDAMEADVVQAARSMVSSYLDGYQFHFQDSNMTKWFFDQALSRGT